MTGHSAEPAGLSAVLAAAAGAAAAAACIDSAAACIDSAAACIGAAGGADTDCTPSGESAVDSAAEAVAAARATSFAFGLFAPAALVFPVCLPAIALAAAVPAVAAAALVVAAWTTMTTTACFRYCRRRRRACRFENVAASSDCRISNLNLAMEREGASLRRVAGDDSISLGLSVDGRCGDGSLLVTTALVSLVGQS